MNIKKFGLCVALICFSYQMQASGSGYKSSDQQRKNWGQPVQNLHRNSKHDSGQNNSGSVSQPPFKSAAQFQQRQSEVHQSGNSVLQPHRLQQ